MAALSACGSAGQQQADRQGEKRRENASRNPRKITGWKVAGESEGANNVREEEEEDEKKKACECVLERERVAKLPRQQTRF